MDSFEQVVQQERSESYRMAAAVTPQDKPTMKLSTWEKVTVIDSVKGYDGKDVTEKIAAMVQAHSVMIYSKSHCPFCLEVKKTFANLNVPIHVLEVNRSKDGAEVMKSLKQTTKLSTVPSVWIKGKHVGGCDDTKKLQDEGKLDALIQDLIVRDDGAAVDFPKKDRGKAMHPLFWFPNVVNNHVVRLTGFLVVLSCALLIVYREETWAHWYTLFLMIDFVTRMVLGSHASVLGMLATVMASPFMPVFKPGPPKQFAAFCGVCFTTPAVAFYFEGYYITGAVILGMLLGAAALEAFLNFCLGCVFFGFGIRFGIIPAEIYHIYANTRAKVIGAWEWSNVTAKKNPPKEVVHAGGKGDADLKYKRIKSDEHIISNFNVIANMQVTYFAMPLGITGLAVAYKLASSWLGKYANRRAALIGTTVQVFSYEICEDVWRTIASIGGIVYIIMLLLYIARLVLFHNKCAKEWHCPMRSPAFGMITITATLCSFLCYDQFDDEHFGRTLWWGGSSVHSLLTIAKFGEWVGRKAELEHIHPSWLILPVGGFVSALVAPIVRPVVYDDSSTTTGIGIDTNIEIATFYSSFAFLMWVVIFTITFFKVVTTHNSDDRIRSQIFIWVAPPAVASMSNYITCFSRLTLDMDAVSVGQCVHDFSQLYWIAIMLLLGLLWAFLPYINFFARNKFNMSYWNYVFSLDVVAAASVLFWAITNFKIAEVLFVVWLAVASVANMLAFLHTLVAIIRNRGIFTPEIKWGPLSFMKLTHEGVRGALPCLLQNLEAMELTNKGSVKDFAVDFAKFSILHHEHAIHEDKVVFREFERYFPNHCRKYLDDHEQDRAKLKVFQAKIDKIHAVITSDDADVTEEGQAITLIHDLKTSLPPFVEHFLEHLAGEEANLNPIGRKHVPLAVQKDLVKRVFDITPTTNWAIIIPYILENLPRIPQRKTYVKALIWGLGAERAQQIGYIIYQNCDAAMWKILVQDLPEIIPRGVAGWRRYY